MFTIAVEIDTNDEGRAQHLYDALLAVVLPDPLHDFPEKTRIFIWEGNHIYRPHKRGELRG